MQGKEVELFRSERNAIIGKDDVVVGRWGGNNDDWFDVINPLG